MKSLVFFCLAAVLGARSVAFGADAIPADLPLPASPPCQASWLRAANLLQPYGHSEYTAFVDAAGHAAGMKNEFGFNTIIVLPTEAHNAITEAKDHLTEAQFRQGLAAYRAAGYRIILYTSVMASGLVPEFQSGQLAAQHPDWLQRDPQGNPVLVYGVPWLCPSGGGRDYALAHTLRLARDYHPDGFLLDNNEFFFAGGGWTCHCAACTRGFRKYIRQRLGEGRCQRLFGAPSAELEIPATEGPLFDLWLEWRNRVWADVNETFRSRLRAVEPGVMLLANTQYLFDNGLLGTDRQYEHEDAVISESVGLNSRRMSEKMLLGGALAEGRPLWNYIGTFTQSEDYTGLKPAAVIAPLIAATLAHGARPWIVDGFDEGQTNGPARQEMSRLLGWHAAHPELFENPPWTPVGVVFSFESRNVLHRPLLPPHLAALLEAHVAVGGLRDDHFSDKSLKPYRVITLETSACLAPEAAKILARWVHAGGYLVAAADAGCFDELGRRLGRSVLWKSLGLADAPARETKVGRGTVVAAGAKSFAGEAVKHTCDYAVGVSPRAGIEVVPGLGKKSFELQIVSHEAGAPAVTFHLPTAFAPAGRTAEWRTPGAPETVAVPLVTDEEGTSFTLPQPPVYSVVKLTLR